MTYMPYECTHPLAFGVYTALPSLPEGYQWIQTHNHWVLVRADDGKFYFVHLPVGGGLLLIRRSRAWLWDWLRTGTRIPLGAYFTDYRYTIFIPPQTTRT